MVGDMSKEELVALMQGAMADAKATKGSGTPAMWTFSDKDTTVNIMGTVHLLKPDVVWKSPAITDLPLQTRSRKRIHSFLKRMLRALKAKLAYKN